MNEQRNLIIAVALTFLIFVGYDYFFAAPQREAQQAAQQAAQQTTEQTQQAAQQTPESPAKPAPGQAAPPSTSEQAPHINLPTAAISSPRLKGSMSLAGGRINDLVLPDYRETVDPKSPPVQLLAPVGSEHPYFAEFGWAAPGGESIKLPTPNTVWQASGTKLTPGTPLTLTWDNGEGLTFTRTFTMDENYMFTVTQEVHNASGQAVKLAPFGRIARTGTPKISGYYILHEGPVGVVDGVLKEIKYKTLRKDGDQTFNSTGGWMGITDKYWLTALIPAQNDKYTAGVHHSVVGGIDRYQVDVLYGTQDIPAGGSVSVTSRLFAGAKEVSLIESYAKQLNIDKFDLAIDWGWFRFLTQPIFHALDFLKGVLGNFGLAILALTVIMRLIFFPLANKQYTSTSKMKKLQPKVKELNERFKDDPTKQREEMMRLYKEEKVNPVSGCLPLVVQIPVFWCLYKVLFVTIEMRHAPFYGWIHDLSAPDHVLILTGFGLFPWHVPQYLAIGVWPLILGITYFVQQKLNPPMGDPTQAKIMQFMPLIFVFLMARFPVGLVIYWTWSNLIAIAQQWVILKRIERKG